MYLGVGHVTVDLLADGSRRAGGSVVYGALAAAARGLGRAWVSTCAGDDVVPLLPDGIDVVRQPSETTTTFVNEGTDRERVQTIAGVAGPVVPERVTHRFFPSVVHLGPVARELGPGWIAAAPADATVVLTPQGLIRDWPDGGGGVRHRLVDPAWVAAVGERPVVVVLGASELVWVRGLGEAAIAAGGALVVTDGHRPATVRWPGGEAEIAPVPVTLADDTGAGDVFATVVGLEIAAGAAPPDAVAAAHDAVGTLLPRIHAALPVLP